MHTCLSIHFRQQNELNTQTITQVLLAAVATLAFAAPDRGYLPEPPSNSYAQPQATFRAAESAEEVVLILRDDRVHEGDGRYAYDVETGNGIVLSESGSPDGPEGAVVKAGGFR